MTITKELNGSDLVMAIEGRLDTLTAPELETEFKTALKGVSSLSLDFGKLEYISSAGLRVLLLAVKTLGEGCVKVVNANEIVKEVFEVTGFDQILSIE